MADEDDDFLNLRGEIDWSDLEHLANNDGSVEGMPETEPQLRVLNEEMIAKRVIWNVLPHTQVHDVAKFLDLPPVSNEILDKEHTDAHLRQAAIFALAPVIDVLSTAATQAAVAAIVMQDPTATRDSEDFIDAVKKLEPVVFHTCLSTLSELIDYGMVHTPHLLELEDVEAIREAMRRANEEGDQES